MTDIDDVIELYALWVRNGKAINSNQLAYIFSGEAVQAGECKGFKKSGKDGAYFSDLLNIVDHVFIHELTMLQRAIIGLEYGMSEAESLPRNQLDKAVSIGLPVAVYRKVLYAARQKIRLRITNPKKEYLAGAKASIFFL